MSLSQYQSLFIKDHIMQIIRWITRGDSLKLNTKKQTYIISIAIPIIIVIVSFILTSKQMIIYNQLIKPPLSPPAFVFMIIWPILYILMGISSAKIILTPSSHGEQKTAMLLYICQLFLNFIWPIFFFKFKSYKISFVIIIMLL